jgi:hypothetical protein
MRNAIIVIAIAGSAAALGAAGVSLYLGRESLPSPRGLSTRRAQIGDRARVSPHESVTATIDGATVTIVYGRPSMRGRKIFGSLVPYGRVWCPGADEATTLDVSRTIHLGTIDVPPGPHTIWMLPDARRWSLIMSDEPSGFHTQYTPSLDMVQVPLKLQSLDAPVEELTFAIAPSAAGGGTIAMSWEKTEASATFAVK